MGGGQDKAEERPTATLEQVFAIAEAIQPRYRLFVLLAAFAQGWPSLAAATLTAYGARRLPSPVSPTASVYTCTTYAIPAARGRRRAARRSESRWRALGIPAPAPP